MDGLKQRLRREYRERREGLPQSERSLKSGQAMTHLLGLSELAAAHTVFCYISFGSELSTHELLCALQTLGKRVCVPKINGEQMRPVVFEGPERCVPGAFGIPEPVGSTALSARDVDLCIAPGLAFDLRGARLGYGGGFYDRFFREFGGSKIGLCFDLQIAQALPEQPFDQRLDAIVSERAVYRIGGKLHP